VDILYSKLVSFIIVSHFYWLEPTQLLTVESEN